MFCTLPEARGVTEHVGTGGRLKKINPYEYSNSIVSSNIVAKNANNIVSSNLGRVLNLVPVVTQPQDEFQWSGILGGTDNFLGSNWVLQGTKTGSIIVGGVSNSIVDGSYGLTVDTDGTDDASALATVQFAGVVGGSTPLGAIVVTGNLDLDADIIQLDNTAGASSL